jgi:hypothetical protein
VAKWEGQLREEQPEVPGMPTKSEVAASKAAH